MYSIILYMSMYPASAPSKAGILSKAKNCTALLRVQKAQADFISNIYLLPFPMLKQKAKAVSEPSKSALVEAEPCSV